VIEAFRLPREVEQFTMDLLLQQVPWPLTSAQLCNMMALVTVQHGGLGVQRLCHRRPYPACWDQPGLAEECQHVMD